jgi:cold shock protein
MRGKVKRFNAERGFGFIIPDDGSPDVFVHIKAVVRPVDELRVGDSVEFDVKPNERDGRLAAVGVRLVT